MIANFIIFYVDDDPEELDFFAETAMSMGLEVIPVNDPLDLETGLKNISEGLKIIFLDINMPVKSGYDLLKEIKANDSIKNLPIIAFSTGHDAVTIKKSWDFGADLFIRKGSSVEQYTDMLKQIKTIDWSDFKRDPKAFVLKPEVA